MNIIHVKHSPIIVGGMGGSGTRVLARILESSGVYMGRFLNPQYDNLLFPLFGFPARYGWSYQKLKPYISLFETMHLNTRLSFHQWLMLTAPLFNKYRRSKQWKFISYALHMPQPHNPQFNWGWKNPQNQYFLKQLNQHFPNCFYVHMTRHGLDMAFTKNLRQLEMYGSYFGLSHDNSHVSASVRQLDLWIKTNTWIAQYCSKQLTSRHYILRFEDLCSSPEKVISELSSLIGLTTHTLMTDLVKIVKPPESLYRYKTHDLSQFSSDQLSAVQDLGYEI